MTGSFCQDAHDPEIFHFGWLTAGNSCPPSLFRSSSLRSPLAVCQHQQDPRRLSVLWTMRPISLVNSTGTRHLEARVLRRSRAFLLVFRSRILLESWKRIGASFVQLACH